MGFDLSRFERAEYEPRTEDVKVPVLAEFFGDAEPVFKVRGLTGNELTRAIEAGKRQGDVESVVKAIASKKDQIEAIRRAIGLVESDTPGEMVKRMEMLSMGCVDPALPMPAVVKLAATFPIEFYELTNRISALTGLGGQRSKPGPSSLPMAA